MAAKAAKRPPSLKILVVDDSLEITATLVTLLEVWGHEVRTVQEGSAVLVTARLFQPEAVLLDIAMPGFDAFRAARSLRKIAGLEKVCLAALADKDRPRDRQRATRAGFDHFLVKPFDLKELERLLADYAQSCKR